MTRDRKRESWPRSTSPESGGNSNTRANLFPDLAEALQAFDKHHVRYLVIGGYAVSAHAKPRFSNDLDLWVSPDKEKLGCYCAGPAGLEPGVAGGDGVKCHGQILAKVADEEEE
jgi:hypothetical protein